MQPQATFDFDGITFEREFDSARLTGQLQRVFAVMQDSRWRTLEEIAIHTAGTLPAISARLRDLRKPKFGAHIVNRRRRGASKSGLFEYRLIVEKL